MLPTADFFGNDVTRLILGDNPFSGHSYIPELVDGAQMLDYYTADNIVKALFEAEKAGYNAYLPLGDPFILRVLRQYRNAGGTMKLIFQPYPAIDLEINLRQIMQTNPIAIYHQGTTTDYLTENNEFSKLRDNIRRIKDTGLPAGLGTHVPETILRAEDEDWGVDFYMASLYNARKEQRGEESGFITGKSKHLVFYPDDRFLMFDVIKKVQKPFLVFKVLAGGQVFYGKKPEEYASVTETVFRETFENIKPTDHIVVGAFQRDKNMIAENARLVEEILTKA